MSINPGHMAQPMRLGQRRRGGKPQPMRLGQLRLFQQGLEQQRPGQQTGAVEAGRRAGAAENMAAEQEP